MAELVVLVLNDPNLAESVLTAWVNSGVPGVTLLPSTGLRYHVGRHALRDDLPLIPSLADLLEGREEPHCTLFAVVEVGFNVESLVAATVAITGSLAAPDTGILFTVPVARVWGEGWG
jgi:hypothetical protein